MRRAHHASENSHLSVIIPQECSAFEPLKAAFRKGIFVQDKPELGSKARMDKCVAQLIDRIDADLQRLKQGAIQENAELVRELEGVLQEVRLSLTALGPDDAPR
jgi:hypothetical protein